MLTVIWLYNRNGDPMAARSRTSAASARLRLAGAIRKLQVHRAITSGDYQAERWWRAQGLRTPTHGVNNGQAIKVSPVWSLISNSSKKTVTRLNVQLMALDKYHGLPNGMFSCDEHLAGLNPSQGTELCTVVETMFSLEHSAGHSRRPRARDRLERHRV